MRIEDFFFIYKFYYAFSGYVGKKIKIVERPLNKEEIKSDEEFVGIYKNDNKESIWEINYNKKVLRNVYSNEAVCIYDFLKNFEAKLLGCDCFPKFKLLNGKKPIGVILDLQSYYKAYLLVNVELDLDAKDIQEAANMTKQFLKNKHIYYIAAKEFKNTYYG